MDWIPTEHTKRKDLVNELTQGSSARAVRGSFIWSIINNRLVAFEIRKSGSLWEYIKWTEATFTEDHNSCPTSYLQQTITENQSWRDSLETEKTRKKSLKQQLTEAFQEAEASKRRLVIETDSKEITHVVVESVCPLKGRHNSGKLYDIPLRRIKSWQVQ